MNPMQIMDRLRAEWQQRQVAGGPIAPVVDWRDYFHRFCEEHGRFPLTYQGLLLFPDGWRHEMAYEGVQYEPPTDREELNKLRRAYWLLRQSAVKREIAECRQTIEQLTELTAAKSGINVHASTIEGNGWGPAKLIPATQALADAKSRLDWLLADLQLARARIIDPEDATD